jgi:hypothetical protein
MVLLVQPSMATLKWYQFENGGKEKLLGHSYNKFGLQMVDVIKYATHITIKAHDILNDDWKIKLDDVLQSGEDPVPCFKTL